MSLYYDFYFGKLSKELKKMDIIGPKIEGRLRKSTLKNKSIVGKKVKVVVQ